ncbi:hypothetical protein K9L16_00560 [Candidatus Pacearchaeota archaeon]|nr:hypothetical protein [Candidatus Pacearchaeota archaeon]
MGDENYNRIIKKLASVSGLGEEEIERKVEAKRAKLAGLISKEGAAQVIAAELGINFDNEKLKIDELLPGMRKVNVTGKIITIYPVRKYTNNKGIESKVANFILADDTSNIKVVLWDTNHIDLIEKGEISEGSVVEIGNGGIRAEEIHLGSFSDFKPSSETFDNVVEERVIKQKKLTDMKVGDSAKSRAFVVQSFSPKFFNVCSECKKKVIADGNNPEKWVCQEHGAVTPEQRALLNVVLDDGTETFKAVLFQEGLENLGLGDISKEDDFENKKQDLLGCEKIFCGNVRMNKYFNQPEFIVNDVCEVDCDVLINRLEKKQ